MGEREARNQKILQKRFGDFCGVMEVSVVVSVVANNIRNQYKKPNSVVEQEVVVYKPFTNPFTNFHHLTKPGALRLAAWLISRNAYNKRDYLNKLQDTSQITEEQVHKLVTNRPGKSGLAVLTKANCSFSMYCKSGYKLSSGNV